MNVRLSPKLRPSSTRRALRRRGGEPDAPARSPRAIRPEDRVRRAGGPQDRALYACSCGYAFEASVTASVHCPRCGGEQAW
ncbi:MAG: hypothetical protein ACR2ML_15125 [Solirubrobacteraceae bacterium]